MATEAIIKRDLAKSLKSENIVIPSMPVTVNLTLDDKMMKLIKAGKEGFRVAQLGDTANEAINKWIPGFQSALDTVGEKLPTMSAADAKDKIKELNDVLVKYAKQLEIQVNKDVDDDWKAAAARDKDLRNYKIVLVVKVTIATLAATGNVLSMIATAGADVVSAVSLVNIAANLAAMYHRESMDMFTQHDRLSAMMVQLNGTVTADLGGFKDTVKNIAGDASPALARFITSTKTAEGELKSLKIKYTKADQQADETVGKINASLDKIGKIVKGSIDQKLYEAILAMRTEVDSMLTNMEFNQKIIAESSKQLTAWQQALDDWNKRNPAKAAIKQAGALAKTGTALASAISATIKTVAAVKALV
jgi:hypothetical protein